MNKGVVLFNATQIKTTKVWSSDQTSWVFALMVQQVQVG